MTQREERPGQQHAVTLLELFTVFSAGITQPKSTTTTDALACQISGIGSQAKQTSLNTWQDSPSPFLVSGAQCLARSKGETGWGRSWLHLTAVL